MYEKCYWLASWSYAQFSCKRLLLIKLTCVTVWLTCSQTLQICLLLLLKLHITETQLVLSKTACLYFNELWSDLSLTRITIHTGHCMMLTKFQPWYKMVLLTIHQHMYVTSLYSLQSIEFEFNTFQQLGTAPPHKGGSRIYERGGGGGGG